MPRAAKQRKLLSGGYYLSRTHSVELLALAETASFDMNDAIEYIDQHGEWLD